MSERSERINEHSGLVPHAIAGHPVEMSGNWGSEAIA
jgi:hypothetical protein